MVYQQYSSDAFTGLADAAKNRIDSNSSAPNAEYSQYPVKFDVFVNKENSSIGSFAVTETHTLDQLQGSLLYIDHRPAVDTTGGISSFVISDGGIIDPSQTDIYSSTIQFSTLPSATPFTISYSAAPDKVQDSHINSLQNVVMALQDVLGIKTTIGGQGTGIVSMPLMINILPGSLTDYQQLQNIVPQLTIPGALQAPFYLGTTDVVGIPGYGTGTTIYIGNDSAASRDSIWLDGNNITLATSNGMVGVTGGNYRIGLTTGDFVRMSGCLTVASQTDIGAVGGARGVVSMTVPTGSQAFYDGAMLRVHGGIWFGSGLSGNGSITFVTTTGQAVNVQGNLLATTLDVSSTALFHGATTFRGSTAIQMPGQLSTDNDITLNLKPNGTPPKIDNLDPSYAAYALGNLACDANITQSVRPEIPFSQELPYPSGYKVHPVYGFKMYPMLGSWMLTGSVAYEKAQTGSHKNVLLLNSNVKAIGVNSTSGVSPYVGSNIGGGTGNFGMYSSGMFNPGDTFIEIQGVTSVDDYCYPIYYHQAYLSAGNLTGLNVYVAADDAALQSSIAGRKYRLFQPGNAPYSHLSGNFTTSSSPTAIFGTQSYADYPNTFVSVVTDRSWLGGDNVSANTSQFKHVPAAGAVGISIKDSLEKSIGNVTGSSLAATGIAYVYVIGSDHAATQETSIQVRASPTPYGVASPQVQHGSPKLVPGQHIAVGEVMATTTDGTTWTHLESTSYRQDGYYDSCWVPLVDYRRTSAQIVNNIGRCLPFYITSPLSSTNYDGSPDSYVYQWYVEHNLGPVVSLCDIDYTVYVASHGTNSFDTNQSITGSTQSALFKLSSRANQNLWTPYSAKYVSTHALYQPGLNTRGFLKDITDQVEITFNDTRFAGFGTNISAADLAGAGNRLAQYIRVIMRKTR